MEQLFQKINVRKLLRSGRPETPHIILANRSQEKLGEINNVVDITFHPQLQASDEMSFSVYKEIDGKECRLWDELINFRLIWVKEYEEWFQITLNDDESESTTKKVITAISLCEAELGQTNMDTTEINTENDILRTDYVAPTVFYNPDAPNQSLMHRLLKKVPNYTVMHVDETLWNIQRTFTIDNSTTVYDCLTSTIAEEIGCLFLFNSNNRGIYVYDLETTCLNCGYRNELDFRVCPECGSTTLHKPYGFETNIFIDKTNLAQGLTLDYNTDSVKNCFKVTGGDDDINAAIITNNPAGNNYIFILNDDTVKDMPTELVEKFNSYNKLVDDYNTSHEYSLPNDIVTNYNILIDRLKEIYEDLPYQKISEHNQGYSNISTIYYDSTDLIGYLEHSMMPTYKQAPTSAKDQWDKLLSDLSPVAVENLQGISVTTIENAVKLMAKAIIDTGRYKLSIKTEDYNSESLTWTGTITIENYSAEDDKYSGILNILINDDYETFIFQRIEKNTAKLDNKDFNDLFKIDDIIEFRIALQKYCKAQLSSFFSAYETAKEVLYETGISSQEDHDLYTALYLPYYERQQAITDEISIRDNDVEVATTMRDFTQTLINETHKALNLEEYLGDLYLTFLNYRREDNYTNSNYISDGLSNAEIIQKATELWNVAKAELVKSNTKQYNISTTLDNLLLIRDENDNRPYESFIEDFSLGNYIRCKIDDKIYKMRVGDMSIDYNSLETISLSFYDASQNNNIGALNRAKELLSKVSSMSTSYPSVQKQAEQGEQSSYTLESMRQDGLDMAQYNLFNTNATITYDDHGLLGRNYDDVTDLYSDEQLRLNGNSILLTDNNWKSTRMAIGKQNYKLNDVYYTEWGVNADFAVASKIIGGDIYSANWTTDKDGNIQTGTHFNLTEGSFELADGRIIYDGKELVKFKDVVLDWNTEVTDGELKSTIATLYTVGEELSNAVTEMDKTVSKYLSGGGKTEIGKDYVITPYIGGGYLNIAGNDSQIILDPKKLSQDKWIFRITNKDAKGDFNTVIGMDKDGNAEFAGKITADSGKIGGFNIEKDILYSDSKPYGVGITGSDNYKVDGSPISIYAGNTFNDYSTAPFMVFQNGDVRMNQATIGGGYVKNEKTGEWEYEPAWYIEKNSIYNKYGDDWKVSISNGVAEEDNRFLSVKVKNSTEEPFYVTSSGYLYAQDAYINGHIYAKTGWIGGENGWQFDTDSESGLADTIYHDTTSNTRVALTNHGAIINYNPNRTDPDEYNYALHADGAVQFSKGAWFKINDGKAFDIGDRGNPVFTITKEQGKISHIGKLNFDLSDFKMWVGNSPTNSPFYIDTNDNVSIGKLKCNSSGTIYVDSSGDSKYYPFRIDTSNNVSVGKLKCDASGEIYIGNDKSNSVFYTTADGFLYLGNFYTSASSDTLFTRSGKISFNSTYIDDTGVYTINSDDKKIYKELTVYDNNNKPTSYYVKLEFK